MGTNEDKLYFVIQSFLQDIWWVSSFSRGCETSKICFRSDSQDRDFASSQIACFFCVTVTEYFIPHLCFNKTHHSQFKRCHHKHHVQRNQCRKPTIEPFTTRCYLSLFPFTSFEASFHEWPYCMPSQLSCSFTLYKSGLQQNFHLVAAFFHGVSSHKASCLIMSRTTRIPPPPISKRGYFTLLRCCCG